jgi:hypothetical protein
VLYRVGVAPGTPSVTCNSRGNFPVDPFGQQAVNLIHTPPALGDGPFWSFH